VTVAVIVQARMGSTRLPGKVLMRLGEATVLDHVLRRCRAIAGVDAVCCAIPESAANDPVAAEARAAGVEVFRGSESDVLDRYWRAARVLRADVILRVTSDCPLLDPAIAADVLALRSREGADYACNNRPPTWPHGLDCEALTFAWLERAAREATKPYDREHVTPYIREHPESCKANLPCPVAGAARHRWTLDTPDDFEFLRALFPRLPAGPAGFGWHAPLAVVEANPALARVDESRV
jgi:spore coat polysaccharide biosynthesis protein SpsF (cytidylyltransferase family)